MSTYISAKVAFLALVTYIVTGFYDIPLNDISGTPVSLSSFQGKKLMIIVLPSASNNTNDELLDAVDDLSKQFADSISFIGVPSYEYGYSSERHDSLHTWYRAHIDSQVVITQGMYTNIASDSLQHPLFKWLTNDDQNSHFKEYVTGPNTKYFISEEGKLLGIAGPERSLNGSLINRVLR